MGRIVLKKIIGLSFLFVFCVLIFNNCTQDAMIGGEAEQKDDSETYSELIQGCIIDYDRCSDISEKGEKTAKANAYYIISENLKDTLLTYNLPDDLFEFPLAFFGYEASEHSFRYDFKIKFTYRMAKEDEKILVACPDIHLRKYSNAKQIIIISANECYTQSKERRYYYAYDEKVPLNEVENRLIISCQKENAADIRKA